jgi:pimeloyl-ACP methyl ester carboxylesterase
MNTVDSNSAMATRLYLPDGIRSRTVTGVNGLSLHVLEAGFEPTEPAQTKGRILLLHGFPELAYSWRKVMLPLARAGYHVIAPDQRGYGQTTGWDDRYDGDVASFRLLNLVQDMLALVNAMGWRSVNAVVGHDFGSSVAAWCALVRPDVFRSVVMMSAPFAGAPALAGDSATVAPGSASNAAKETTPSAWSGSRLHEDLAALPRPRKHYQWYYSTQQADGDMRRAPQGIHAFLRAYYHHKSADWKANRPFKLKDASAAELAKMPTYYLMDLHESMAETVAHEMPTADEIARCDWLPKAELAVYAAAYDRTGFQGPLNWYRCSTSDVLNADLKLFAGRTIDVPACYIAGASDWGIYQKPGAFEAMQHAACTRMTHCHLVQGAGHWVQQEQPQAVVDLLLDFLR